MPGVCVWPPSETRGFCTRFMGPLLAAEMQTHGRQRLAACRVRKRECKSRWIPRTATILHERRKTDGQNSPSRLTQHAIAKRCHAGGRYMRAVEFRDISAAADDADAAAEIRLQIHVGSRRDERQHLAAAINECELRRTRPTFDLSVTNPDARKEMLTAARTRTWTNR